MKTEFFQGSDVDTSNFADPAEVAETIWQYVEDQRPTSHIEIDIAQGEQGLNVTTDQDGLIYTRS